MDIDSFDDQELLDISRSVIDSWGTRNIKIGNSGELRNGTWHVPVPKAWRKTAKEQHSSKPADIAHRVPATLTLRDAVFSRNPPDEDLKATESAVAVARYFQGRFQQLKSSAVPGRNGWLAVMDQLVNRGAACVACLWAPHDWSGPIGEEKRGKGWKKEYWRGQDGKPTEDGKSVDDAATARYYDKVVSEHRRLALPPVVYRAYNTEETFPLFSDRGMEAMFIERTASPLELRTLGFVLDEDSTSSVKSKTFLEAWTPNRCRYYLGGLPLKHKDYGSVIETGYGFVPFAYREGMGGGDPLLALVDGNIRTIDTWRTYIQNLIYFMGMPLIYMDYDVGPDAPYKDALTEASEVALRSGVIMDFGPGRRPKAMELPGFSAAVFEMIKYNEEEVDRIVPRTLQGQAESSGYNTVQTSAQAKAIFNPILDGAELLLKDLAVMEMKHIEQRVQGPVYLDYAERDRGSSKRAKLHRVRLEASDIGGYYGIDVQIDRQLDYITESQSALQLKLAGVVSGDYVRGKAGIVDTEAEKRRIRLEAFEAQPNIAQMQMAKAARIFGVEEQKEIAAATGRIVPMPDGTPGVMMPDGSVAAPGQTAQTQGPMGAMLGGANPAVVPGAANLGATANPNMNLPTNAAPTGRMSNRGGATRGLPQRQPTRPPAKPVM